MKLYVLSAQNENGKCYVHNVIMLYDYSMMMEVTYERGFAYTMPKYMAVAIQRYYNNRKHKGILSVEELK